MIVRVAADGRRYNVREIQSKDREHLVKGLEKMSPATRYHRFHSARNYFTKEELDFLIACDGIKHISYVSRALGPENEEQEGIGVTRFFRDPNNAEWGEVAIVVIDAWQGGGIGTALLEALASHCLRTGVKGWRAAIIGDNDRAVHTFEKFGKVVLREWEERSLVLHLELNR